jgi:hypothetical protein
VRASAPTFEQRKQPLLRSASTKFHFQSPEDRLADEPLLRVPYIVFGLRLDECRLQDLERLYIMPSAGP